MLNAFHRSLPRSQKQPPWRKASHPYQ